MVEVAFDIILIGLIIVVCALLPESPFNFVDNLSEYSDIMGMVNYFIPVSTFVAIMEGWLVAVAAYYGLQAFLRWTKVSQ